MIKAQVQNSEIAEKFNYLADLLEIEGANPFRVRAYRNAARTLTTTSENATELVQKNADLSALPGIGKDLATKIKEVVETGHLSLLDQIEKKIPIELRDFLKIPSLGPKRIGKLYKQGGVKNFAELRKIVESKKILGLRGFGEKTRLEILEGLNRLDGLAHSRLKIDQAHAAADLVLSHLKKIPLQHLVVAGSLRRKKETVGDIDLLATAKEGTAVIEHFLKLESIAKVLSQGPSRSTVKLCSGVQIDLRVVPDESYGAALLYLTGSKAHNIALRTIALNRGLKLNEYGIFKGTKRLASKSELDMYHALKLPYIVPELRENRGEIEAAFEGILPQLIHVEDIRGDLHVHTQESDGADTIEDLVIAARRHGYSYLAISDHSKRMKLNHELNFKKLLRQIDHIDHLNQNLKGLVILKSSEVDILEDGTLDLPSEVLEKLDFTVCSIHSKFRLSKEKQTKRILRAMENPNFNILGHPTGRLIETREPISLDMDQIILTAKRLNKVLEINSQPERMDLSDIYCKMAKDAGVKMAISTDAHSISQMENMKYGIGQARRGWLEKHDVINTFSLSELKRFFKNKSSTD